MKALVYTELRKLELKDWPRPEPAEGEALIRIGAVGVCGSDVHGWAGHSRGRVPPLILGHEMAGEVVETRSAQPAVPPGTVVAIYPVIGCGRCAYCAQGREALCRKRRLMGMHVAGGFAEYVRVPVANLYPVPAQVDLARAALTEPLANALHFVRAAEQDRGPAVLMGAGAIGLLMLQVARQMGFSPLAVVEPNAYRAQIACQLGADLAVSPQDPGALERLLAFFGEDGCATAFDAAGFATTRQMALHVVRSGGLIVLAGLGQGESVLDFVDVTRREVRLAGVYGYSRRDFETAVEAVTSGCFDPTAWLSEEPLDRGQEVFENLARADSRLVKVVLRP